MNTRSSTAVARHICHIVADVLEVEDDEVEPSTTFYEDLTMDSLQKAEVVVQVERAFGTVLEPSDAAGAECVADLVALLSARGAVHDDAAESR